MKLPVVVHRARLGADEFRVVRPAGPLSRAVLIDHDRHLDAYVDQDAARGIAGLWMLAARSPRSLIHVPLRANRMPVREVPDDAGSRLDLVLLHHSLQFAPSHWKRVRGRLGPGRPQTVSLPEAEQGDGEVTDPATRHHRENRDLFHQHLHAETLFMTGSAKVFRETARHFLDVARKGPGHIPVHPGHPHFCTELHSNDGILGDAREIHIEYCDQWPS
ncbi:hypothetical protein [Streptomyces sp. LaPpAH-108]|uniref:hypothetical protein n=1 Tax=Streptomyces sp. LaPpAH-108 TaxID=1155714 RepID=UPI00037C641D|nr:hypothetical protein [Streptomyces sp. LaPpAH-108]